MFGSITPVVRILLIINVALFILDAVLGGTLSEVLSLYSFRSDNFLPVQFITYGFLHGDTWHLLGNMIGLLVFGPMLEMVWGSKRFLIYYMVAIIGVGVLYGGVRHYQTEKQRARAEAFEANSTPGAYWYFMNNYGRQIWKAEYIDLWGLELEEYPESLAAQGTAIARVKDTYTKTLELFRMLGASGAIFAILLGAAVLFPNRMIFLLFPPIPLKIKYLVLFYGAYTLYSALNPSIGDRVAHTAHLAGILIGYLVLRFWYGTRTIE